MEQFFEKVLWQSRFLVLLVVVTDIVGPVDIYLIAIVWLIFGLGTPKLFISRIEQEEYLKSSCRNSELPVNFFVRQHVMLMGAWFASRRKRLRSL